MSEKTLYFCDRCKKEVKREDATHVKIGLEAACSFPTRRYRRDYQYRDLCNECVVKLGFVVIKKDEKEKVEVELTTAEKLYDIVAQMISEQTERM